MSEYFDLIAGVFRGHTIRGFNRDGKPWFVANDLCAALGYGNVSAAISKHVKPMDKGITIRDTPSGPQKMLTVSESGMYCLILRSKKPEAEEFQRWVTEDLLPSIRKGAIITTAALEQRLDIIHNRRKRGLMTPDDGFFLLDRWLVDHRPRIYGIGTPDPTTAWVATLIHEPEPYIAIPAPATVSAIFDHHRGVGVSKAMRAMCETWRRDGIMRPQAHALIEHQYIIVGAEERPCFCFTADRMTVYNQKASEPARMVR